MTSPAPAHARSQAQAQTHAPSRRTVLGLATAAAAATGLAAPPMLPAAARASSGPTDDTGGSDFSLVREDGFAGSRLDPRSWELELGNIRGNEQQHYSSASENIRVQDGKLVIQVTDRPEADQYRNTDRWGDAARVVTYNSGSARTHAARDFLYRKIEVRAKLPRGKGAFPAIWTLGHDFPLDGRIAASQGYGWPATGEIDIVEMIGAPTAERAAEGEVAKEGTSNRVVHGTPHFWYSQGDADGDGSYSPTGLGGTTTAAADLADVFHVYAVNRTPAKIEWLLDDVVFHTMSFTAEDPADQARLDAAKAGLDRPAYLQLNLATGGNWAGDAGDHLVADGASMIVDHVRFSQTPAQKAQDEAYRAAMPTLSGITSLTSTEGEATDLVADVTVDSSAHVVQLSVNDSPQFVNSGAPGGRNEVTLRVDDADDAEAIAALAPGVYSLYYTAVPTGADLTGGQLPTELTHRARTTLTVTARV